MIPVDISDDQVTIRTEISIPLSRNSEFFNEDLLFFINLLNENVHDVDILSIDEEENARLNQKTQNVDWELLPVGSKDVPALLKARLGNTPHNNTRTDERIDFFSNSNLPIDHYITGKGSFERYFGMAFDNGVVVLEDFNYGNATYVFHDNWENFSQMSRLDLIHLNSTEIERIVHNRNWKTRLKYIVTASTRS